MRLIDADKFKEDVLSGLYIYLQVNKEDIARAIDDAPTVNKCNNCDLMLKDYDQYMKGHKDGYKKEIKKDAGK